MTVFGGGGKDFIPNKNSNTSYLDEFLDAGYQYAVTNATLAELDNNKRALGLFGVSTLPTWLDRHVYPENLKDFGAWNETARDFSAPSKDVPGLKDMTLKALNILHRRAKNDKTNFMMMSEAASIDKAMHASDYQSSLYILLKSTLWRPVLTPGFAGALGELLELDDTVKATIAHLEEVTASIPTPPSLPVY